MQRNRHTARLAYLERHKLWAHAGIDRSMAGCMCCRNRCNGCHGTLNLNGHKDAGATQGLRIPVQ